MKSTLIIFAIVIVGLLVGSGYAAVVKRSVKQQGTLTEERGRQIEEQSRAGHRAVINELNNRFEGYRDKCYPMPKGCRCEEGDKLVRYQEDRQCKGPKPSAPRGG